MADLLIPIAPVTPYDVWTYATRVLTNPASAQDLANMLAGISPTATGRAALIDNLTPGAFRVFEGYTLNLDTVADNDATYVTVQNISGRGILLSVFAATYYTSPKGVTVRITIDGGAPIEKIISPDNCFPNPGVPILKGFNTSCLVEMKLSAAGEGRFGSVALVE